MIEKHSRSNHRLISCKFPFGDVVNSTSYTPDEIEWCEGNMPIVEIEVCAKEFGYYNNLLETSVIIMIRTASS